MPRLGLLTLFALSGASSLTYEIVWMRLASTVVGSSLEAVTAVVTTVMLGLGLGSALVSRSRQLAATPLAVYGRLELAVACSSFCVPFLLRAVDAFDGPHSVRFGVACLVLTLPAVPMGATLAALTAACTPVRAAAGRISGALNAAHCLGAFAGILLTSSVLLPRLGATATNRIAVTTSALVAMTALLWSRRSGAPAVEQPARKLEKTRARRMLWPAALAAVSGAIGLGLEVVWTELVAFVLGDSTLAFACILAAFLGGIGAGSLAEAALARRRRASFARLGVLEGLLGLCVLVSPWLVRALDAARTTNGPSAELTLGAQVVRDVGASLAVFGLPAALLGAAFPLCVGLATRGGQSAARVTGVVFAANTAGAIVGALVTGLVLVPVLGFGSALGGLAMLAFAAGAVALSFEAREQGAARWLHPARVGMLVGATLSAAGTVTIDTDRAVRPLGEGEKVVFREEGRGGLVEVTERNGRRSLLVNRRHRWGDTNSAMISAMLRQATLPLALHPAPAEVLEIGLATGVQAVPALEDSAVRRMTTVEISPAVVRAAGMFAAHNADVLRHPKSRIVVDDGRRFIHSTRERFDLVILGLFVPYQPQAGALYSRDTYQSVKQRLSTGGLAIQWVALEQTPEPALRSIVRSFVSVFPDAHAWERGQYLALVGARDRLELTHDALERNLMRLPRALRQRAGVHTTADVLSSYLGGVTLLRRVSDGATLNTDDHPVVEFLAQQAVDHSGYRRASDNLELLLRQREDVAPLLGDASNEERALILRAREARGESLAGAMLQARGDHRAAISRLRRAAELYPDDEIARIALERYQTGSPE